MFQAPSRLLVAPKLGALWSWRVLGNLYIAKLCQSVFQRQIALYSPCWLSLSRFVTITPSIKVRNLTYVHHIILSASSVHHHCIFNSQQGVRLSRKVMFTEDLSPLNDKISDVLGFLVLLNFQWDRYASITVPGRGIGDIFNILKQALWGCKYSSIEFLDYWSLRLLPLGVCCQCLDGVLDIANGVIIS